MMNNIDVNQITIVALQISFPLMLVFRVKTVAVALPLFILPALIGGVISTVLEGCFSGNGGYPKYPLIA